MKKTDYLPITLIVLVSFLLAMIFKPTLCFTIIGIAFCVESIRSILFVYKMKRSGIPATGIIIAYNEDSDRDKTPIIEFTTETGDIIQETPAVSASARIGTFTTSKNRPGQQVDILYDRNNPKYFITEEDIDFTGGVMYVFAIVGLLMIGLSITHLLGYIRFD